MKGHNLDQASFSNGHPTYNAFLLFTPCSHQLDELYSGGREYTALDVSKWLVKGGDPPTPVPKELYHPLKDDAKPKGMVARCGAGLKACVGTMV